MSQTSFDTACRFAAFENASCVRTLRSGRNAASASPAGYKAASLAPWSSEAQKLAHLDQAAELGGARADIVQPPHGIRKYGDKKVLVDPG